MSTPSLADRLHAYLDAHTTLNLATHGPAGLWAAAVLYVREGDHLYFTSVTTTRHGQNLVATHRGAGTINDDHAVVPRKKGVQLEGRVERVDDEDELARVAGAYLRRFPSTSVLWHGETDPVAIARAPGTHRFFRLTPARMYFWDSEHHPQGREEVALPS